MSARVFVHPRCWSGPAFGTLSAYLETDRLWDMNGLNVGPMLRPTQRELVRYIGADGEALIYERMDGVRIRYCASPAPEAA